MSSKATILLTVDNEHWYGDLRENIIILEIDDMHKITKHGDRTEIEIKEGTPLFEEITKLSK